MNTTISLSSTTNVQFNFIVEFEPRVTLISGEDVTVSEKTPAEKKNETSGMFLYQLHVKLIIITKYMFLSKKYYIFKKSKIYEVK